MKKRKKLAARAAIAVGAAMAPEAVQAAVITVNSTADTVAVDAQCTLREAITNANDNAATSADCAAGTGSDTIDFALTLPATITLTGSLSIVDPLIIDGPGEADLTIDANDGSRIFHIEDADSSTVITVEIDDLTLTNGNALDESIPAGGAIYSAENLTLTNVTINSSEADAGGGVFMESGLAVPSLIIVDSTFTANEASYGGAIFSIFVNVSIAGSTLQDNVVDCCGGAINLSSGDFTITNSTVTGNSAFVAGGIALYYVTSVTVSGTTISDNDAVVNAGGLYIYAPQGPVTIEDSVISGNNAGTYGGGLFIAHSGEAVVTITDTEISGNIAGDSTGGLYLYDADNVTIERMRLINNTATNYQGGAAIWDAKVTIIESQITGNQAASSGGLYVGYGSYLYLINSTVANNTATTGSVGGLSLQNSFAAIEVSTISGNSAPAGAAGNIFAYQSYLYISNSIVANGTGLAGPDLVTADSTVEINHSLLENTAGATFTGADNLTGVDPQLGPLQDNGGPTETMKPLATSPAVNAGDPDYTTPANDQRGFPRPVGIVDMGAVEINPGVLQFAVNGYNVNEGVGVLTVTVSRTGGADGAVGVNYATSSSTATSGADFIGASGTLNWADNDTAPKTFDITITDDLIFEGSETFNVSLNTPTGGAALGLAAIEVSITDNDSAPTISIADSNNTEGSNIVFNVTLSNPTTQTVTVDFATAGGTATSGGDFTANGGTVTFTPGDTSEQITVVTAQDPVDEPDETFSVALTNPNANATIFDGTAVGTINDDDPTPTISINDVGQTEGTNIVFAVTLSGPSSQTITVDFTTAGGDATPGVDYTANSGTITFVAGDTSEPITVVTAQDTIDEVNETFNVNLANPTPGIAILDGTGTGTITDDDAPPTISISDVTQLETDFGVTSFIFNVTLSQATSQIVTVDFSTAGISATSTVDFLPTGGTLTFSPMVTSQPVTVQVVGDVLDEPNETFNVNLTNPNANATILDGTGLGTITDDDGAATLNITDVALAEGTGGTTNFVFTVTLAPASGQTVTVDYATHDVTATAGSDYSATSGTLTFTPGDPTETITVPVTGDADFEPNEGFNVVLSNAQFATIGDGTAAGTILNDDALPSLTINNQTLAEGNSGTTNFVFTVTLTPSSTQPVTVNYTTQDGTAVAGSDYTATAGMLTFAPGDTSETITVPVSGDTNVEPDETFSVVLSNAPLATISDGAGDGTIVNDDVALTADLNVVKALAGTGPFSVGQNATFNITLSNAGPDAAANATVTDILPPGTSLVSATPTSGTCIGTTTVTCNVGTLPNGGNATITLIVQLNAAGQITNTATATSDAGDLSPALGSATFNVSPAVEGAAIPTLSQWMLIALASALACLGVRRP